MITSGKAQRILQPGRKVKHTQRLFSFGDGEVKKKKKRKSLVELFEYGSAAGPQVKKPPTVGTVTVP